MSGPSDREDKEQSRKLLLGLSLVGICVVGAVIIGIPIARTFVEEQLSPGIGLKDAALYAFIATVAVLVILALAAGDGLLGELQFMLASMASMFVFMWVAIAWLW